MKTRSRILLVEDFIEFAELYKYFLRKEPIDLTHVTTGSEALKNIQEISPEVILLDLTLPDMNGMEILKHAQQLNITVIVTTSKSSIDTAVEVMRNGAFDFLEKPVKQNRLIVTLRNALHLNSLNKTVESFQKFNRSNYYDLIGTSPLMRTVYQMIDTVADTKASVFLNGESGTGKELCAAALHKQSQRQEKPFVVLDCAAIPKELIESELFGHVKGAFTGAMSDREGAALSADSGTLFLDEIGDMDLSLQTRLLRFVQTGTFHKVGSDKQIKVDVRFICATNRDLQEEIEAGRFREDLYYRLNVINIHLPPLRQRGSDILLLARYFLSKHSKEENRQFHGFTDETEQILLNYNWPGNVRQLQNYIYKLVILSEEDMPEITADMLLPFSDDTEEHHSEEQIIPMSVDNIRPLWQTEKEVIEQAIELTNGNISEVARRLEISTPTIYRKLKRWNKQVKRTI
ncbi:sigma-54 dependent transcriptional regulator [Candidatus Halobeggiatoa sp. HSG11]|nr:sigma-54 dependent transcriptional regulator [Candidatus Halobeggiatoa sp. HSG11]